MAYNPEKHHRRSIRLKGYDYARVGTYFVTVCTHDRTCLFGNMADGMMALTDAGRIVQTTWDGLPEHYPGVELDAFVLMPNHVHGIILLGDAIICRGGF
jgi:REP element-mobilizing transposase RayT